jgi:hypothetical protein
MSLVYITLKPLMLRRDGRWNYTFWLISEPKQLLAAKHEIVLGARPLPE